MGKEYHLFKDIHSFLSSNKEKIFIKVDLFDPKMMNNVISRVQDKKKGFNLIGLRLQVYEAHLGYLMKLFY